MNSKRNKKSSYIRSSSDLDFMRKSGQINASALKKTLLAAKPGVSLRELDKIAEVEITRLGGQPAFKTVPGYYWATCLNINDEVVHGIPRDIELKKGDILSVDVGTIYQGWYTDAAWSVIINGESLPDYEEKVKFLEVGKKALWNAIQKAVAGNRIGDISWAIQSIIEGAGFSIIKSLSGHGVGQSYHEEPEIPGFGNPGTGSSLEEGMTLAIEAIYAKGNGRVYEKSDGWTIASVDGSLTGLFEATVIVGSKKAEVITSWEGLY